MNEVPTDIKTSKGSVRGAYTKNSGLRGKTGRLASKAFNLFNSIGASFKRNFWDTEKRRVKSEYGCGGAGYDEHHSKAYFCFRDKVLPIIGYAMISPFLIVCFAAEHLGCCSGQQTGGSYYSEA